jgi:hypothetical protein
MGSDVPAGLLIDQSLSLELEMNKIGVMEYRLLEMLQIALDPTAYENNAVEMMIAKVSMK